MKTKNIVSRVLDGLIIAMFVLFLSSAGFQDKLIQGWYQQWLPDLNGSTIKDITFLDSLTGFAVTTTNSSVQAYILKTTNGGDNWNIVHTYVPPSTNSGFIRIQFANNNVGYSSTNYFDLFKTTNGGINWINYSSQPTGADDFCVINIDTLFYVYSGGFGGGVYRTTNGGINWSRIWTNGSSGNPSKIYMYDKNLGFTCDLSSLSDFRKTTNGGFNWISINPSDAFSDIKFIDTLTGWKGLNSIKKTTDGGLTWSTQAPPSVSSFNVRSISIINKDTVWLGGLQFKIIGNTYFGVLCKTTNGGTNWGYQIPNMSIDSGRYHIVDFIDKDYGWAYKNQSGLNDGIHTKVGGNDSTIYSGLFINTSPVISDYGLYQNYPNPFNSKSNIKYRISKTANIKIAVYDLAGRELLTLVDERKNTGEYSVTFDGGGLSSGVYFYALYADGKRADTRKMLMIK